MERLRQALIELGAPSGDVTVQRLCTFMELVLAKNEVINLTTITDRDEFIEKHLIDSIACYGWKEIEKAKKIIDVGTGAGFPGIPLAILYPEKEFLLLDSLNKRIEFLNSTIDNLGLPNVKTIHSRAEDAGVDKMYREKFDLCFTRAISHLPVLLEYCVPFIRVGGFVYAYKGIHIDEEIEASEMALMSLGASIEYVKKIDLNDVVFAHSIVAVIKNTPTPRKYPRKAGTPKKVPL